MAALFESRAGLSAVAPSRLQPEVLATISTIDTIDNVKAKIQDCI